MSKKYSSERASQLVGEALNIFVESATKIDYSKMVKEVLEYYLNKMQKEFTANYKNTALKFQSQYEDKLSDLSKFVLDSVATGKYMDSIKVVSNEKDNFEITIDPKFAICAGVLEYANSEIPAMPHWAKLQSWLEGSGIDAIAGMIQDSIANDIQNKLDSLG